jgi:hypothetical protein
MLDPCFGGHPPASHGVVSHEYRCRQGIGRHLRVLDLIASRDIEESITKDAGSPVLEVIHQPVLLIDLKRSELEP